jgi:hypothetical protein
MDRPRTRSLAGILGTYLAALIVISSLGIDPLRAGENSSKSRTRAENERFFEQSVRPILVEHCHACHAKTKPKGSLRLDSLESILQGGDSGPAVVPGKPVESLLIEAIHYRGLEMPPKGKLAPEKIAVLEEWVSRGTPWPGYDKSRPLESKRPDPGAASIRFTDDDRRLWSLQPVRSVQPPALRDSSDSSSPANWSKTAIDPFILNALADRGLTPATEADKTTLIRRVTFDVTGLPPTPEEIDAFTSDRAPDAYERLVDRLLASPRYGQHWARHWLDLVRYADSDGYRQDGFRPAAWRYRDYVIAALDNDKPYDRFLTEQLAGDELDPEDPELQVAVGYLRLGTYEFNQRNVRGQWADILNDITDVTGETFLGLSIGCARCHDHKFDPILQRDYFRLQAFFTPLIFRDETTSSPKPQGDYAKRSDDEPAVAKLQSQMAAIEQPYRDNGARNAIVKFSDDIKSILRRSDTERSPLERQIGALAYRQVQYEYDQVPLILKGPEKERWTELNQALTRMTGRDRLNRQTLLTATDVGPTPPPTVIPGERRPETVEPGMLSILEPSPAQIVRPAAAPHSTGRRLALARWLTQPDNPLTARVIVNRVWQYHFGRGVVGTSSDFGRLGDRPTHPQLLDWLSSNFIADGWRLKPLHRLILTSAAYRQSSLTTPEAAAAANRVDPENRLLWHWSPRRLSAEEVRDAMLSASGELDPTVSGASSLPAKPRRAIGTRSMRNTPDPVLSAFDGPDGNGTVASRYTSTTATQALLVLNGEWALARARFMAGQLEKLAPESTNDLERVSLAYRRAFGRYPTAMELDEARSFSSQQSRIDSNAKPPIPLSIDRSALVDFCHVLLNANEFFYVD